MSSKKTTPVVVRVIVTAIGALLATVAIHAAPDDDYAYSWPLQTQGDSAAWQIELTPEIYAAVSRADLRDVEVVNAANERVPVALYSAPATDAHEDIWGLPIFSLPASSAQAPSAGDDAIHLKIERGADGKLRSADMNLVGTGSGNATRQSARDLLLDASALHAPTSGLRILWNASGQSETARFAVSASDDLQQWQRLVDGATVMHLVQDGGVLERHDIALNTHSAYLRLRRLDDGPDLASLVVQARTISPSTTQRPARQWIAATLDGTDTHRLDNEFPSSNDTSTVAYRYHLPAPLAVEAIRTELADDNSLARLFVLSRQRPHKPDTDDRPNWARRAQFLAFRLREGDATVGNDEVFASAGGRAIEWRIEVATPLSHAPVLSVAFRPDRFIFLAQGKGPYRLVAGSARALRAEYPVDAALAPLRAKLGQNWQPPLATLGARTTLQGESALKEAPPVAAPHDWRSWLLWAVLVAAAALVGGLALSLLRTPKP